MSSAFAFQRYSVNREPLGKLESVEPCVGSRCGSGCRRRWTWDEGRRVRRATPSRWRRPRKSAPCRPPLRRTYQTSYFGLRSRRVCHRIRGRSSLWVDGMSFELDPDSLSALYREHAEAMLVYFARRSYDPQLALDLVGETFARAHARRRRFRGASEVEAGAWLWAIAHNVLSDALRRGRAERRALQRLGVVTPRWRMTSWIGSRSSLGWRTYVPPWPTRWRRWSQSSGRLSGCEWCSSSTIRPSAPVLGSHRRRRGRGCPGRCAP